MIKPLLVLDFDETLIHCSEKKIHQNFAFQIPYFFVYLRPNLKEFLIKISVHFELAIWSTATNDYLDSILNRDFFKEIQFNFIWDRTQCDERYDRKSQSLIYIKNLSKIKTHPLQKIIIVDDTWEKIKFHYKNSILIKEFRGDIKDKELSKLYKLLFLIKDEINFRQVPKKIY